MDDGNEKRLLHASPDGLDIGRQAADNAAYRQLFIERHGHAHEVGENLPPQRAHDFLAEAQRDFDPEVENNFGKESESGVASDGGDQLKGIAVAYRAVYDGSNGPRKHGELD